MNQDWKTAAVSRAMFDPLSSPGRRTLLFENVSRLDIQMAGGIPDAKEEVYAMALGTTIQGINATKKFLYPARLVPPREHLWVVNKNRTDYGLST